MSFVVNDKCLLCDADVSGVLSLPATPPANSLPVGRDNILDVAYPLDLMLCGDCGHLQLGVTVDPEILFRNYTYVSPPGMLDHWRLHAAQCIPRFRMKHDDLVVDIGGNNGDLLNEYQRSGMRVLNVEPATDIAKLSEARGVPTWHGFFSRETAPTVLGYVRGRYTGPSNNAADHPWIRAKLITMNNAFAHVRDLRSIVEGVKTILAPDGVFICEVHWRGTLVAQDDFTSVYHEHLAYWALGPAMSFFASCGTCLFDVQSIPTHNGSMRVFVQRAGGPYQRNNEAIDTWLLAEQQLGLSDPLTYVGLDVRIQRAKSEFKSLFDTLTWGPINAGGVRPRVAVLGCPAKLTTLAYTLGLNAADIAYVCDDAAEKQGKFTPGKRWPIKGFDALVTDPVQIAIVGVSNYVDAVVAKAKALCRAQGVMPPIFVNPLPTAKVIP